MDEELTLPLEDVDPGAFTDPLGRERAERRAAHRARQERIRAEARRQQLTHDMAPELKLRNIKWFAQRCFGCGRMFPSLRRARYCPNRQNPRSSPCRQRAYRQRVQRRLASAADTSSGTLRE